LRRTLAVSAVPAAVFATAWLRLEDPIDRPLRSISVAGLALLPALVRPFAARVAVLIGSLVLGAWIAFELSPLHPRHLLEALGSRFSSGFLDFYSVRTPFDPRVHQEMRGVLLTAVFGFTLALALAVAAQRPVAAVLVVLVGAGWPATLRGSSGAFVLGALILLASLAVMAGLTNRAVPRGVLPAAIGIALLAVAASTSTAVAKGGIVAWQRWNFHPGTPPVSVQFVWNAQYSGLHWPSGKRTTVLEVKAPNRSLYWRAAVLDDFTGSRWQEAAPLRGDALEPATTPELEQQVHILALDDTHLVGASVPVRFDAGDAPLVSQVKGIAQLPSGLAHGFRYTAWSEAPQPTEAELQRSRPLYPIELTEPTTFLDVAPGVTEPPFGHSRVPLNAVARTAASVTRGARTPYAAATALEDWFRTKGGFRYTNSPPSGSLTDFILRTRAGYCQHFAGAMALMLRYLGVPARVAVGFSSGTYDSRRGVWRVTDHDAHAWVEVWFRGYGWLPFDPTPAAGRPERGELSAPYAFASRGATNGHSGNAVAAGTNATNSSQTDHRHGETPGTGVKGTGTSHRAVARNSHGSLLALLALLVGGVIALIVAAKLVVRRVRYLTRDPRRLAAACRQELADYLVDQHIDAARSATLHELGAIVQHELSVEPDAFVSAATAARFGPPVGAHRAAREARRELRVLLRRMRVRLRVTERVRGLLSLRSFGFTS
jgi:transglutaminase-like putative cysteine protease